MVVVGEVCGGLIGAGVISLCSARGDPLLTSNSWLVGLFIITALDLGWPSSMMMPGCYVDEMTRLHCNFYIFQAI